MADGKFQSTTMSKVLPSSWGDAAKKVGHIAGYYAGATPLIQGAKGLSLTEVAHAALGLPPGLLHTAAQKKEKPEKPEPTTPTENTGELGGTAAAQIVLTLNTIEQAEKDRHKLTITTLKRGFQLDEYAEAKNLDAQHSAAGPDGLPEEGGVRGMLKRFGRTKFGRGLTKFGNSKLFRYGGAAFAGITGGISKYLDLKDRDDLSTGQKASQIGATAAGGAGGALLGGTIGGAIGTLIAPGIGTAVGAMAGEAIGGWLGSKGGEMIGEKISDNYAAIKGFAIKAFDTTKSASIKAFEATAGFLKTSFAKGVDLLFGKDRVEKLWASLSSLVDWVKDGLSHLWGGIKSTAVKGAEQVAKVTKETVKQIAENPTVQRVAQGVTKAAEYTAEKAVQLKDWVLGQTSKMFESGKGGAGTVSTGRGDAGGASYGTYQLSSKTGTLDEFLKDSGYAKQFQGLRPGSSEFNAKWKEIAQNDPNFGNAQHDFIKRTHFDKQMAHLKKGGVDLSGRGAAVQDAVWSTSVQFGGSTDIIKKALKGQDPSKMSDEDIVRAIQEYKKANNDSLFKSSSDAVRAGTLKREQSEEDRLVALARRANTATASTDKANVGKAPAAVAKADPVQVEKAGPKPDPAPVVVQTPPPPQPQQHDTGSVSGLQPRLSDIPISPMDQALANINTGAYQS